MYKYLGVLGQDRLKESRGKGKSPTYFCSDGQIEIDTQSCARHCSKHFRGVKSFNFHSKPMK